jgi:raffinose/stachyose/melibiose transport system substrate-binding protein
MDQWLTAAKTIHDKSNGSVYAMYIGGGDGWPLGLFYNFMADNAFVNNNNPDGAALIAGTYDWSTWPAFVTKMKTFFAYVNPDYLTAKNNSQIDDMAKGMVAFDWGSGDIPAVLQENSDMKWSFVPLPAWKAGDQPAFVGDVHDTLAIWNKSTVSDDARLFLDFWADPTNMKMLCDIDGYQAGLTGVSVNGIDTARYATFKNNVVMSMFDEHELPNGMWNDIVKGAAEFNSGAETAQQWADDMKTSYTRLYAAAHAAS